jgi:hypothetical protein
MRKKQGKTSHSGAKETLLFNIPNVKCKAHFKEYNSPWILSQEMAALHEPVADGGYTGTFEGTRSGDGERGLQCAQ